MEEKIEQYTPFLMTILQNENSLVSFLDIIFGFLRARTDFYHILTPENKKTGFIPGQAKKILLSAFHKQEKIAAFLRENARKASESKNSSTSASTAPAAPSASVDVVPEPVNKDKDSGNKNLEPKVPESTENVVPVEQAVASSALSKSESVAPPPPEKKLEEPNISTQASVSPGDSAFNERGECVYLADPDQYNGASFEHYSWSQNITELDVKVKIPDSVQSSKQLDVSIGSKSLVVKIKSAQSNSNENKEEQEKFVTIFEGKLKWAVKHHDAMWLFNPKDRQLHVNFDKVEERWWDGLIEGETVLDTRRIDCSRPMEDLDEEAQAKIQELMYDQHQKRLGKPTIQEQKMESVLKKAFHAEGSPFAGQEFDLSKFNLENSGNFSLPPSN